MGVKCSIILTFSAIRKRKQEHTLNRGTEEKLIWEIYSIICSEWKALFYRKQKRDPNKKAALWEKSCFFKYVRRRLPCQDKE